MTHTTGYPSIEMGLSEIVAFSQDIRSDLDRLNRDFRARKRRR